jgi:Tfp pilus assembly protein PilX
MMGMIPCEVATTYEQDNGESKGARCAMLTIGMVVLGVVTFLAMIAFVTLCDKV